MSANTCPEEGGGSNLANPCPGPLRNPDSGGHTHAKGGTASAALWLREALAGGPVESAGLKANADAAGIGPKALRLARQDLNLVVKRSGCGKSMRSTWALPAEAARIATTPDHLDAQRSSPSRPGEASDGHPSNLGALAPGEIVWRDRRVAYFLSRGIGPGLASDVAAALTERDRRGRVDPEALHMGSCAECQMLEVAEARCETGSDGHTTGPRLLTEVWLCWHARRPL